MYLNSLYWLRGAHTLNLHCCDIFNWTCIHLSCWNYVQNALSFKKMYTLLGLSRQVIKLQYKKQTNVSFALVFEVRVHVSCALNVPCQILYGKINTQINLHGKVKRTKLLLYLFDTFIYNNFCLQQCHEQYHSKNPMGTKSWNSPKTSSICLKKVRLIAVVRLHFQSWLLASSHKYGKQVPTNQFKKSKLLS